jgi:hypothetical protein
MTSNNWDIVPSPVNRKPENPNVSGDTPAPAEGAKTPVHPSAWELLRQAKIIAARREFVVPCRAVKRREQSAPED